MALALWYRHAARDLPWRRTSDPYAILVSEFMLQQTQVATVIPYFERWMARFPGFSALAKASEAEVLGAWEGLGYYARGRNLHAAAREVHEQHGGKLPDDPEVIRRLPGVGRYTAGAVAAFGFDRSVAAVDANIARVLARLADCRERIDTPTGAAMIWSLAEALLPETGGRAHTSALMELGALVCIPRAPRCPACPVVHLCRATEPELLPVKAARRATVALLERCAWVVSGGCFLLERQTGRRWRGLWKLPPASGRAGSGVLYEAIYPFTHHRVTLQVYPGEIPPELSREQHWFPIIGWEAALPSPHRRAVETLLRG